MMTRILCFFCFCLPFNAIGATKVPAEQVKGHIAIIIDDLGYKRIEDQRALNLPAAITLSFLPQSPYVRQLAEKAFLQGNEIMLHLPMQSVATAHLGPGALTIDMNETEFKASVTASLNSVPHVQGINNHMGSLLTRHPGHMSWLMELIKPTDLFFIDSRTTTETVAETLADEFQIPNARRNVFLDHDLNRSAIEAQFKRLIKLAKSDGYAIGIGHPYHVTLDILEQKLSELSPLGIQLIPVSELIQVQQTREILANKPHRRNIPWQTSLSRSPQDARN